MERLPTPQVHELVQLAFLAALTQRLPARHYVLKGGANLRLFFRSPRSSEDMDFDAVDIPDWKLADKVDEALEAPVLALMLRAHGVVIQRASGQKQTTTTQRWIVEVKAPGHRLTISTTGEFSHRLAGGQAVEAAGLASRADPIPVDLGARYGAPPIVLPHYLAPAALAQKIGALANRAVNQPRDIFDLDLIISRHPDRLPQGMVSPALGQLAAERATELDFAAFRDAVVPFIDEPVRAFYSTAAAWSAMQERVLAYLLDLAG